MDIDAWTRAFLSEIDRVAAELGHRTVVSVFFGGGTPSLMPPALVEAILSALAQRWTLDEACEITLEANPTSTEAQRFAGYRLAGVNRVSVGVQALDDADLRRLGRLHSAAEALVAIETARQTFDRVSMDLIYARQGQGLDAWRLELATALSLGLDHYALYQLTIEPGTAFGARHAVGGLAGLPDEDLGADLYNATQAVCEAHGLPAYEVSNHARPGAESRHNLVYWTGGDYVGLGPGAHGRLTIAGKRVATVAAHHPETWLAAVGAGTSESRELVPLADDAIERLLMGLRIRDGVSLRDLRARDPNLPDAAALTHLGDMGLIDVTGDRLRTTAQGRLVLNAVTEALIPG